MIVLDILHCEVTGVGLKVINDGRLQNELSLNRRRCLNRRRLNDWSVNGGSLIVRVKRARSPLSMTGVSMTGSSPTGLKLATVFHSASV